MRVNHLNLAQNANRMRSADRTEWMIRRNSKRRRYLNLHTSPQSQVKRNDKTRDVVHVHTYVRRTANRSSPSRSHSKRSVFFLWSELRNRVRVSWTVCSWFVGAPLPVETCCHFWSFPLEHGREKKNVAPHLKPIVSIMPLCKYSRIQWMYAYRSDVIPNSVRMD